MPGRHLPPDRDAGDESTLGGYMAVHARPAAFDGPDGLPYSVDLATDDTGDPARPFGAYLLFLRWRRMGEPGIDTYLESGFLTYGETPEAALDALRSMPLHDVKAQLDQVVRGAGGDTTRKWWDVMRDEDSPA
jgi:hypothetical protein